MASKEVLTALETLHRELEKLAPAIKHVETAQQVTQTVKTIPQKHLELLKEVKESDIKHKGELKDLFSSELRLFTSESNKLAKTTADIQQQVKYEQIYLAQLREATKELYNRIEQVRFSERFDKQDANDTGLMATIQSVQTSLDNIDRNITDRLMDLVERQKEAHTILQANVEAAVKKQSVYTYVTWMLIVIAIAAMIFIK